MIRVKALIAELEALCRPWGVVARDNDDHVHVINDPHAASFATSSSSVIPHLPRGPGALRDPANGHTVDGLDVRGGVCAGEELA